MARTSLLSGPSRRGADRFAKELFTPTLVLSIFVACSLVSKQKAVSRGNDYADVGDIGERACERRFSGNGLLFPVVVRGPNIMPSGAAIH